MATALYPVITDFCSAYEIRIPTSELQWLLVESVKRQTQLIFSDLIARAPSYVRERLDRNNREFAQAVAAERSSKSESPEPEDRSPES